MGSDYYRYYLHVILILFKDFSCEEIKQFTTGFVLNHDV